MISSFEQAEEFINGRNNLGIKLGLERITTLLEFVDNPHLNLNAIHVAGTNGKGSTIYLLEGALISSGYSVGIFTSPSFTGIRGHMTINQTEITEDEFVQCLNKLMPFIQKLDGANNGPTSFEVITVISFLFFQQSAQIVLVETGMGGKDDTTNVIDPILSIITNVEKDHTQFLGDSYEEIATHKAGIIKHHRPVVIGRVNEISEKVIDEKAELESAPTYCQNKSFNLAKLDGEYNWSYKARNHTFTSEHLPAYQVDNIANAMMALTLMEEKNYDINWHDFYKQLSNFSLQGRFELISHHPKIIIDSAHNHAAVKRLIEATIEDYPNTSKHVVFSAFRDKDVKAMINLLENNVDVITLTTFSHERALNKGELAVYESDDVKVHPNWREIIDHIMNRHKEQGLYIITGSLHFIVEVRQYILQKIKY